MSNILQRNSNTITIAQFWESQKLKKYNYEPPYQRLSVWPEEKQSFFIDSILRNYPIPPIFLRQHIDDNTGVIKFDVIDGKQRLESIISFIENRIPVSSEVEEESDLQIAGIYFDELKSEKYAKIKSVFWRYKIPVEYIDTESEEQIENIFDRLNRNGEPLKGQELRNAKYHSSKLLNMVVDLSEIGFWKERLKYVDVVRMENYEFLSELVFSLLERRPLGSTQSVIDEYYKKYTELDTGWEGIQSSFLEVTTFLEELNIKYEEYKIHGVSHLYGLWCFAWYCSGKGINPKKVSGKLDRLFFELRDPAQRKGQVQNYKITMSAGTKMAVMRRRRLEALIAFCGV